MKLATDEFLPLGNTHNLGVPTIGSATLPLNSVRAHWIGSNLMSRGRDILTWLEAEVFGHPIATFINFCGDIFRAHVETVLVGLV